MNNVRFNSLPQLAGVLTGFAVAGLLLESEALVSWADRLDVGAARDRVVQTTEFVQRIVHPLGIDNVRRQSLTALDRLGWSDDPARLEEARLSLAGIASPRTAPCNSAVARSSSPSRIRQSAVPPSLCSPAFPQRRLLRSFQRSPGASPAWSRSWATR